MAAEHTDFDGITHEELSTAAHTLLSLQFAVIHKKGN